MITLQGHVLSVLSRLADIEPKKNIKEVQELLRATLLAEEADFGVHGRTLLANLLEDSFSLELRFRIDFDATKDSKMVPERLGASFSIEQTPPTPVSEDPPSVSPHGEALDRTSAVSDIHLKRAIQGLDRQERRRDFVWIGHIAQTLLPSLGLDAQEAQQLLDEMLSEGIVSSSKVPNPNNPDFPTTRVQLNREHPRVKQILKNGRREEFRPIKISGPPVSEDIIRDRR